MNRPRLSENRSSHPFLNAGELLVAVALPVSRNVHQVSIVIREDGRFECAERITPVVTRNTIYHKETGRISDVELKSLSHEMSLLASASSLVHDLVPFNQVDPFEFETRDRRTISYWRGGKRESCSVWDSNLYELYSIPSTHLEAFMQHFDLVWKAILPIFERPHFESEILQFEGSWKFPLRSTCARN